MSEEQKMNQESNNDIIITIEDSVTGETIKYKVNTDIGKGIKRLMDAIERTGGIAPSWDSGCRV